MSQKECHYQKYSEHKETSYQSYFWKVSHTSFDLASQYLELGTDCLKT